MGATVLAAFVAHPPPPTAHSAERRSAISTVHTVWSLFPHSQCSRQKDSTDFSQHSSGIDTTTMSHSSTSLFAGLQLKQELEEVCTKLLPLVVSVSSDTPCPSDLLSYLTSDLREMENEARSKVIYSVLGSVPVTPSSLPQVACCVQSLSFQPHQTTTMDPALSPARLEVQKREAEDNLVKLLQMRAVLDTRLHLHRSPGQSHWSASDEVMSSHIEQYMELHGQLNRARSTASDLSKKKVGVI